jgi:hypothetical protein
MNQPIPLRPDYSAARRTNSAPIFRAAMSALLCRRGRISPSDLINAHWRGDRATELMTRVTVPEKQRAATTPASESNLAWAGELTGLGVASMLDVFGAGGSAAATAALPAAWRGWKMLAGD